MKKFNIALLFILLYSISVVGQNSLCDTLIHYMNFDNNQKSLAIISGADFNLNCISEFGSFPLGVAASRGNLKLVKELLKKGANPNLQQRGKYHKGETPLFDAAYIYEQELDPVLEMNSKRKTYNYKIKDQIAKVLLDYGADVNIKDDRNHTALMTACRFGRKEVVKMFIQAGVDTDVQNINGDSALMYAVYGNHMEITKILIKAGANKEIKNKKGETALDIACENNYTSIMKLLQY